MNLWVDNGPLLIASCCAVALNLRVFLAMLSPFAQDRALYCFIEGTFSTPANSITLNLLIDMSDDSAENE